MEILFDLKGDPVGGRISNCILSTFLKDSYMFLPPQSSILSLISFP